VTHGCHVEVKWDKGPIDPGSGAKYPENLELISPPFQLEGNTIFTNKYWEKSHWKTLWADTEGVLIECLNNGGNGCWSVGSRIYWTAYNFNLSFVKYSPPPSEEWRALYWKDNFKPEVSACAWTSKKDCELFHEQYKSTDLKEHNFMYAIRTDINAKENK
jgi:hypothetical protein